MQSKSFPKLSAIVLAVIASSVPISANALFGEQPSFAAEVSSVKFSLDVCKNPTPARVTVQFKLAADIDPKNMLLVSSPTAGFGEMEFWRPNRPGSQLEVDAQNKVVKLEYCAEVGSNLSANLRFIDTSTGKTSSPMKLTGEVPGKK